MFLIGIRLEKMRIHLFIWLLLAALHLFDHGFGQVQARTQWQGQAQQPHPQNEPSESSKKTTGALRFSQPEWDFGVIREQDGKVTHTFLGRNEGTEPLVIVEVTATCGCTVPEFSRKPVLPGEQTRIVVTFDPLNRPGSFSKELSVFSSRRERLAGLRIMGSVVARERSPEEAYPFDFGEGLRLDGNYHAFAYLYRGRPATTRFGAVNTTDEPMTLHLEPLSSESFLTFDYPPELAPGESVQIDISCLIPADGPTYGTVQEQVMLYRNGLRAERPLTVHGIAVDPPSEEGPVPHMQLGESVIRFGALRRSAGRQSRTLTITNSGTAPLTVRAVESPPGIGCSLRAGERIAPGRTLETTVTLDPAALDYGAASKRLLLVTDDPQHPTRTLRLTAIIED